MLHLKNYMFKHLYKSQYIKSIYYSSHILASEVLEQELKIKKKMWQLSSWVWITSFKQNLFRSFYLPANFMISIIFTSEKDSVLYIYISITYYLLKDICIILQKTRMWKGSERGGSKGKKRNQRIRNRNEKMGVEGLTD